MGIKKEVAKNPGFFKRMDELDPQHLIADKAQGGNHKNNVINKKGTYQGKIKKKTFHVCVLIERLSTTELVGRSFPKPVPKKISKFHSEVRGDVTFLVSLTVWEKHKDEVLAIIEKRTELRIARMISTI